MYTKTCKLCKKEFETKAHNALYCPVCRKVVKNKKINKESINNVTEQDMKTKNALQEKEMVTNEDSKSDLIKMAEQNVLNQCRETAEWINIMRRIQSAGDTFYHHWNYSDPIRDAWHEGMNKARNALYYRLAEIQAEAYMFVGVGGKEAEKYAREKFRERFSIDSMDDNTRHEVMSLLDKYLKIPHCSKVEEEEEFRRQAKEKYEATKK